MNELSIPGFSKEDVDAIIDLFDPKRKFTTPQLKLFFFLCKERGLDPRLGQVRPIPRWNKETGQSDLSIVTTIDGFRAMAERTGCYAPGRKTEFSRDENGKIISATAYIKKLTKDGTWHEIGEECFLSEYMPEKNNFFWLKMPSVMTAKVSEAKGFRRGFPEVFSKVYSEDEMEQSHNSTKEKPLKEIKNNFNNNEETLMLEAPELAIIDEEQYHHLISILGDNLVFKNNIINFMKQKYGIEDLSCMPVELYSAAMKRAEKYKAEEPKAVNE